jgi:hypothetical protein
MSGDGVSYGRSGSVKGSVKRLLWVESMDGEWFMAEGLKGVVLGHRRGREKCRKE